MITLTSQEAFAAYEAVRRRLPDALPDRPPHRRAGTLDDIADEFDVFLLDAFGVLNIGDTAIPGVKERIDGLRAAGKRVLVVSNAASYPREALTEKYARLGFDFAAEHIVTSRDAMLAFMTGVEGQTWGAMLGDDTRLHDFGDISVRVLGDMRADFDAVDGFFLVGSGLWSEARQAMLEASLQKRPRRVLVANPDIVAPREDAFSTEPGHFAHRLADATGVEPEFFGKPFPQIYDLAFRRIGTVDRARVLMVGDSLHTDILGAHAVGIRSALVAGYGFFAGQDAEAAIRASGIMPDFILERP